MTNRLPTPGGDDGTWGDILNAYLDVSHNTDGTLANNTVGTNQIKTNAVTNTQLDTPTQAAITKANSSVQTVNTKTPDSTGAVSLAPTDIGAVASSSVGVANGIASLDNSSKLTGVQLPAVAATKWQPNTAYTAGQQVISPNNDVVSAAMAHTSGATYTAADWTLSATFLKTARTCPWATLPLGWDTGWQAAKAAQSSTPAWLAAIGDSVVAGQNSTDSLTNSWIGKLRTAMLAAGNSLYGDFYPLWTYSSRNANNVGTALFALTGGQTDYEAAYGRVVQLASGATATFTSPYACTAVDIIYLDYGSGSWTYTVDGGAAQTVTTTGGASFTAAQIKKVSITGLSSATHTIVLNGSAGNVCFIVGISTYAASSGIGFARSGYNGMKATDLGVAGASNTGNGGVPSMPNNKIALWSGQQMPASTAQFAGFPAQPSLAIIALGLNDASYGSAMLAYENVLVRFVKALRRGNDACSILMMAMSYPDSGSDITLSGAGMPYARYKRMLRETAGNYGCGFVDIDAKWGETGMAKGFQGTGNLHPNDAGYQDIATVLGGIL